MRRRKSTPWLHRRSRLLIAGIATTGAVITAYLVAEKLLGQQVACPTRGCEQVLNSPYASVFGQPLALWGFLTYLGIAVLALLPYAFGKFGGEQRRATVENITGWLLLVGATGMVIFSSYLMYLLAFEIRALCIYCMASAIFSLTLWILALKGRDWPDIGRVWFTCAIVAILVFLGTLFVYSSKGDRVAVPELDQPISDTLLEDLKAASQAGLAFQGSPTPGVLVPIASSNTPQIGKPEVLYVGADYCPYCAGVRWALVLSLLRFGELNDLRYMQSSPVDVYSNTATFSFYQSSYESQLLNFAGVEIQDREGKPLEKPTPEQVAIFQKFNAPPYTNSAGAVPFIYIGGRYIQVGASFRPDALTDLSWQDIAGQLKDINSPVSQAVLPSANQLTAAICQVLPEKPEQVCDAPGVKVAATTLPPT